MSTGTIYDIESLPFPSSPFATQLRSISRPSPSEYAQLRDIVEQTHSSRRLLETKIEDIRQHPAAEHYIRWLQRELARVQHDIDAYESLFSPIRMLLPELLTNIFLYCLPSDDRYIQLNPQQAPLLLTQVCGAWRDHVLATPILWSALNVDTLNSEYLDFWLSRSKTCPLSLSLSFSGAVSAPSRLLHIWKHSHRWQHISIHLPLPPTINFAEGTVPLLESLDIRMFQSDYRLPKQSQANNMVKEQFAIFLSSAPRLRSVSWNGPSWVAKLPWNQVVNLSIYSRLTPDECLDILENAQALERATFETIVLPSTLKHRRHCIHHPQLSYLALFSGEVLLDYLILPALRELKLNLSTSEISIFQPDTFLSFVDRSQCTIERFHLHFAVITEDGMIQCITKVQDSLLELTIQGDGEGIITDRFLTIMSYTGEGDSICLAPRLETFAIYNCLHCSPGALAIMVRSRLFVSADQSRVERLKVVEMFQNGVDVEELKLLRSEGLILKLYSPYTLTLLDI